MANLIQIKRSLTTATAPSLANGELAFTANGDHLFIGSNGASITIAGKFNPGVLTANQALVANGTGYLDEVKAATLTATTGNITGLNVGGSKVLANATQLTVAAGVGFSANGSLGSANQVLRSTGTSIYWADDTGDISAVTAGDGLTGGGTNGAVQLDVVAGNGISVSADAVAVNGGSTLTVNSTGVHVNSALSITDLTLSGNLTVTGTLTTLDTQNLIVEDPIIKLANGNASTDSLDIGFFGVYGSTGAKYSGFFRDATDGIYKLYTGSTEEPTTTVNTAATGYTLATLSAYLNSGALTTNSSVTALTANSTHAVNVTANTIKLSTLSSGGILVGNSTNGMTNLALGTDGYVLQSNGTTVVYGTLDGGTF